MAKYKILLIIALLALPVYGQERGVSGGWDLSYESILKKNNVADGELIRIWLKGSKAPTETWLAESKAKGATAAVLIEFPAFHASERTTMLGMLPILPTAALYAGIEEGFFEDRGIEVTVETGQGGAALLPAVMAGQIDFATSNPVSLLQARGEDLDVRVIAHWTSALSEGEGDINGVVAAAGSGIESAADLAGRTVAVNTLNGMGGLTIREAVRQDGGDPDAVEFVELPFPDMPAALSGGNVDAVWVPEPFLSSLQAAGNVVASYSSKESVPGHPTQLFFTSPQLMESDPELVEDFTAAVEETLEFADANPDAVKAQVAQVLPQLPPGAVDNVRLEEFGTDLRRAQIEELGELMVEDGLLDEDADVDGLLPEE